MPRRAARGAPAKATINEVAQRAGVSIKTVSRVVNREPNVRPEMRRRVQEVIDELGYQPDLSARSLASRRSYTLGLLYARPTTGYLLDVQEGVLSRCTADGYRLLLQPCTFQSPALEEEIRTAVAQSRVDGLILTPPLSDKPAVLDLVEDLGTPYARLSAAQAPRAAITVSTDEQHAAHALVRHLISFGHREIALIAGPPDHAGSGARLRGYRAAMAEAGLRVREGLIAQGDFCFESGEMCARRLLAGKRRPTAIFACNDYMAAGALKTARQLGIAVPEALSIAGYDDARVARFVWPALTTVRQPVRELAQLAATLLIDRLRSGDRAPRTVDLRCEIVVRESTGPVPASAGGRTGSGPR